MTLIDLGDTTEAAPPAAAPVNLSRLRRLVLAGLSVLGVLVAGASAAPTPSPVRTLWTTAFRSGDTMAVDDGTVYVHRGDDSGPTAVTAYDLATGRSRWSGPAGAGPADRSVNPVGDVLLVPTSLFAPGTTTAGPGVIVLDAATGAELWRSYGDAVPSAATGDVLLAETGQNGITTALRLVRLRDGHEVWRHSVPPAEEWTTVTENGRPSAIVAVTGQGDATVYRYADGTVLHRDRIPWNGVYSAGLAPAGPHLIVVRTASAQTVATVYSPGDLRPLWRTGELIGSVAGCGPLICAAGVRGVAAYDAGTGREIWRRDDVNYAWDLGAGRLLLSADDVTSMVLADTATGRTIGGPYDARTSLLSGATGSMLLLRAAATPDGRTAVARLDLATGRQTVLGTVVLPAADDCRGAPGHLLCTSANTLTVTAVGLPS
ncbi:outer membrane protein assembly factor BamB family protein [Paractinoplanes atraurantiacus]|uniref:Outer membrane protein assembly factor BamB, contains PQQ-like beta-propeller repeat n=1 Tax=Paractinoplanes atraurantiacus TaxID=1036182 RepID=A0A285HTV6_9ACTN|nr:PQQ-binding-like beta-propeller repeat protein [Actinoplanes atraurantiacus]SNY39142.1 Outer membrane protein assembly factor BamB, contains PQQ-like beta-propeller repeat [Actinoplanes atraurantiacus]